MSRYTDFNRDNDRYSRNYNTPIGDIDSKYRGAKDDIGNKLNKDLDLANQEKEELEQDFLEHIDETGKQAKDEYGDLKSRSREIGDNYKHDYEAAAKNVNKDLNRQGDKINQGLNKANKDFDQIKDDVDNVKDNTEKNINRYKDDFDSKVKNTQDEASKKFDSRLKNTQDEASKNFDKFKDTAEEKEKEFENEIAKKKQNIESEANKKLNDVKNEVGKEKDELAKQTNDTYKNMKANATDKYDDIKGDTMEKFEDAKETLTDRKDEVENEVEKNLKQAESLKENVGDNLQAKKSEIQSEVNKVQNGIENDVNKVQKELESKDLSSKMALVQDSNALLKGASAPQNLNEVKESLLNPVVPIECKDVALYAHNYVRKLHGVNPCKWDTMLAQQAEEWAIHLARSDSGLSHSEPLDGFGENLYISKGSTSSTGAHLAVLQWYKTIMHYNFNDPKFNLSSGTFTQMIWDDSVKLGVGVAYREDTKNTYVVAQYSPPGNGRYSESFRQHVKKPLAGLPAKLPRAEDLLAPNAPLEGEKKNSLKDVLCYWCTSKEDKTVESWSGVQQQEDTVGKDKDIKRNKTSDVKASKTDDTK